MVASATIFALTRSSGKHATTFSLCITTCKVAYNNCTQELTDLGCSGRLTTRKDCHRDLAVRCDREIARKHSFEMPVLGDALIVMVRFRHRHIFCLGPRGQRMHSSPSLRGCREPLSHFKGYSRSDISTKARVFFGVVSIFAGTYACLSPGLAEVEEGTSQDGGKAAGITTLSNDTVTNIFIGNSADDDVGEYISTTERPRDDIDSRHLSLEAYTRGRPASASIKNPNGFDDVLIPDAVWSLDVSTGAHIDHTSAGPGSEFYSIPVGRPEINDLWLRVIFGSGDGSNPYNTPDLPAAPPRFQVASCGGSSAERSNLDYCNSAQLIADQLSDQSRSEQSDSDTDMQGASNNGLSSGAAPTSNSSAQTSIPPFPPAIADIKPLLQGTLIVMGSCGDVSVSCSPTQIFSAVPDSPASPSDDPIPSTDPPYPVATPGPVTYVADPGSGPSLPPVITPEPLKPIPEASTWVMTITGFSVMFFMFRKKRRPRVHPISIVDFSEVL